MSSFSKIIILLTLLLVCFAQYTIIKRDILKREKRYLTFPKGSNLVIQLSAIKSIQQVQPIPWNFLGELEFPFSLPDNATIFNKKSRISKQRRDVYSMIKHTLQSVGYESEVCLKKIVCDARYLKFTQEKSMVNDIIHAIFNYCEKDFDYAVCTDDLMEKCSFSILNHLVKEKS